MGADRIELSGFTNAMRDRLSAYDLFHEIISWKLRMFVPIDTGGVGSSPRFWSDIRSRASSSGPSGRHDHARICTRTGAPSRARGRGGVPPLSLNGRREGHYWLVGDVKNTPGRSMFVRLKGPETGKGAAGKWTDAATGEHGDLLDVIRATCGLADFHDVADEARRFLNLPRPEPDLEPEPEPAGIRTRRIAGIGAAPVHHVAADYRHNRGSVSADTRHYCFARNRSLTFPSALLLPAR